MGSLTVYTIANYAQNIAHAKKEKYKIDMCVFHLVQGTKSQNVDKKKQNAYNYVIFYTSSIKERQSNVAAMMATI